MRRQHHTLNMLLVIHLHMNARTQYAKRRSREQQIRREKMQNIDSMVRPLTSGTRSGIASEDERT